MEYVALTRDTTESDLKQRREITKDGSVVHVDLTVVRAALQGRILVIVKLVLLLTPSSSVIARGQNE